MSPIDVGGALPPPPPPPRDEDRERTDREKDRERDDRAQRFLKTVHESAHQGRERLAQQDAAVKKQAEREVSEREGADDRADHARTEGGRENESGRAADARPGEPKQKARLDADAARGDLRRAANAAQTAGSDRRRSEAPKEAKTTPHAAAPERPRGSEPDDVAAARPSDREDPGAVRTAKKRERKDAKDQVERPVDAPAAGARAAEVATPPAPGVSKSGGDAEPAIPHAIVRQAVEFAAFSERGGIIEFSLGLAGGASLTLAALGNRKIKIRIDHRGPKVEGGDTITRADLEDLVARLRQRGIDVTEIELC